jgi:hypothetical protein
MVLPLFAALVIVCVLFGKALYEYIQLTHAANEGARLAAVNQPAASSLSGFLTGEYALPGGTSLAICYPDQSVPADSRNAGKPVEVVAYSSASWVPILNIGQIKAKATMRLEQTTTANSNLNPLNTGEC